MRWLLLAVLIVPSAAACDAVRTTVTPGEAHLIVHALDGTVLADAAMGVPYDGCSDFDLIAAAGEGMVAWWQGDLKVLDLGSGQVSTLASPALPKSAPSRITGHRILAFGPDSAAIADVANKTVVTHVYPAGWRLHQAAGASALLSNKTDRSRFRSWDVLRSMWLGPAVSEDEPRELFVAGASDTWIAFKQLHSPGPPNGPWIVQPVAGGAAVPLPDRSWSWLMGNQAWAYVDDAGWMAKDLPTGAETTYALVPHYAHLVQDGYVQVREGTRAVTQEGPSPAVAAVGLVIVAAAIILMRRRAF